MAGNVPPENFSALALTASAPVADEPTRAEALDDAELCWMQVVARIRTAAEPAHDG